MSWQLSSFAIVLGALALAFWWYERSRPPVKMIAVIATLAALAALGRDAFAAVPDVKPITVIVLVSGIAFGAGPGFAVGAVGALASNFLLGQGPWTPWQMLAWGLVGLIGGALGTLGARRMPPLALAVCCALAAESFNLVMDLYQWTVTGSHTLAAFLAVLASGLAFDLTHVFASFAFGLLFGATLLRMLLRARARLNITWQPAGIDAAEAPAGSRSPAAGALAALALIVIAGASLAPAARADVSLSAQIGYLRGAQNRDGGFGAAPRQESSELYTAWAAIGLAAAGVDPAGFDRSGHSVLDALRSQAGTLEGAGDMERTILALRACGAPADSLGAIDPVSRLLADRSANGSFEGQSNLTAFAILALRAAGYPAGGPQVSAAADWLLRQQEASGGFGFAERGDGADVDDTAAAVEALAAADRFSPALQRAVAYLSRAQRRDGGFPSQPGGEADAQSTAWAVQALIAAGRRPGLRGRAAARAALHYLHGLIQRDGSVRYSTAGSQTPVWVTSQAIAALAGRPLPVAPVGARAASLPAEPLASAAAALQSTAGFISGAL